MKISEFAERNQVTPKTLRHYDEIGLLKPAEIDADTGYRSYSEDQCHRLNWILILKNLEFSLTEIRKLLDGPIESRQLIQELVQKRIQIAEAMNTQIIKRIQIDRLIHLLDQEGFSMNQMIDLMTLTKEGINEIKKYMPNTEMFVEASEAIAISLGDAEQMGILRLDLCQFKTVNDTDGYEVGDKVIVALFKSIQESLTNHLPISTVARAGGDEFIIAAKIEQQNSEQLMKAAKGIVANMAGVDFSALGCHKQVHVYIGGIIISRTQSEAANIREWMDLSIEMLSEARQNGPDSIVIKPQ